MISVQTGKLTEVNVNHALPNRKNILDSNFGNPKIQNQYCDFTSNLGKIITSKQSEHF